jgi:serine acetyltransferase
MAARGFIGLGSDLRKEAVVAAVAVAPERLPAAMIVAGVPAKRIGGSPGFGES